MSTALTTEYAGLYSATTTPEIVDVPDLTYFMIDGSGAPGSDAFESAIKAIYQVSYAVIGEVGAAGDRAAMPLEALWGRAAKPHRCDRARWRWTLMLLPPSLQGHDIAGLLDRSMGRLRRLRPELPIDEVCVRVLSEGRCVQALHVGPYQDEPTTISRMLAHAEARGYSLAGRHHEVYLSDPDWVAPQWLRTILRVPIEEAQTHTAAQGGEVESSA